MSRRGHYIPLFWRLFVPNAAVLLGAGIVLTVEPANGRVVVLAAGVVLLLTVNLLLMRRAFGPLSRLAALMDEIDPLKPGRRVPRLGPESEVTRLTDAFNGMLDRLETERRESGYRALVAETAERRRVASELHDEVGQRLTALLLRLERIRRLPRAEAAAEFDETMQAGKETLEVVRGLAQRLRPEVLDELGLVPALRSLCDRIEKSTGLIVRRSLAPELPPLPEDAELVVYRVAQEALTNVVRHAAGDTAHVALSATDGRVELSITDDGIGIAAPVPHDFADGIRGMRERALLIGARLEIGSLPEGGTRIRLQVPVTD